MAGWRRWTALGVLAWLAIGIAPGRAARAGADIRLDRDFIAGIIEKLPPVGFDRPDQYHGFVHHFQLIAIEARSRQLVVGCKIDGEFRAPVNGPISDRVARSPRTPEGWRKFGFDVTARVNVEPAGNAAPRFQIAIEQVKRRDLDGATGLVAKALGQLFDDLITQFANGRASRLSDRLNGEIARSVAVFREYGVFCGIEYAPNELVLHFDLTRLRSEGIAGFVFAEERPGTVPLYRWAHPADGSRYYTIRPNAPDRPRAISEGIACFVPQHGTPEAVPLYRWSNGIDHLYTMALDGERVGRLGYRHRGVACYVYRDPQPGTVPLYRFFDPRRRQHFYSLHPYAEFLK
jgi:hypothetical protein